ncbi:DEAD/DEAH box helicase [Dolosicoccus paucivorans]|uniref:DEAD/DEAH box helicase n=1 Tax=Dolosicoccus paucivorans TaxID=84521 RepID=UPI00087E463A|nr:DEAD/DEAH box helicase [Dolosicoccus paucivorans]SDI79443.1 Superfamily II DNA and RNA helicase [Dolosicoccus paucivorans]
MTQQLLKALEPIWKQQGYQAMTPIQEELYQPIKEGKNIVATSPTGTGKTLAYLCPLLEEIQPQKGLQLLIIAPSQELVSQLGDVVNLWATPLNLKGQILLGGANFKRQVDALKAKPEIIIATPGRLNELAEKSSKLKFHLVKTIVFDEADYLMNPEHRQSMAKITKRLMRDVQKIWISATLNDTLRQIAQKEGELIQPEQTHHDLAIKHQYVLTPNRKKSDALRRLAHIDGMKGMVFFDQVHELEKTAAKLVHHGIPVAALHSDLSKQERELAMRLIHSGQVTFLLTTDVAARGLDIGDLPFIIHFNKPRTSDSYLHRSGRTGRSGKKGQVISLVNEQELKDLQDLLQPEGIALEAQALYEGQIEGADQVRRKKKNKTKHKHRKNKGKKRSKKQRKNKKG